MRSSTARAVLIIAVIVASWSSIRGQVAPVTAVFTFGGSGSDIPAAAVLDANNNIFITGRTTSQVLPGIDRAFQKTRQGDIDGFIAKLDAAGRVIWASFLGGNDATTLGRLGPVYDNPLAIAVDPQGNVYIAGDTGSTNFPAVAASQPSKPCGGCGSDGFLTKVDPTGSRILYSTYVGNGASVKGVAAGVAGDAHLVLTMDPSRFPVTHQLDRNSGIVVARFNPVGVPMWFTSVGVPAPFVSGLSVDGSGQPAVAAFSSSAACRQAVTPTTCPGTYAFKLDSTGTQRLFEWNLGSSITSSFAGDINAAPNGIVIGGRSDQPLPVVNAWQPHPDSTFTGNGFVAVLNGTGRLETLSYVAGAADKRLFVDADLQGNLHVAFDTIGMEWLPGFPRPQHPDGPVFVSSDAGRSFTWASDSIVGSVISTTVDPVRQIVYATTPNGIYRSVNQGRSWLLWDFADQALLRAHPFARQRPIAVDPADPSTVYIGAGHLLKIENDGRRVSIVKPPRVESTQFGPITSYVVDVSVSPHDGSVFVSDSTGITPGRTFRSTDGGASWQFMLEGTLNAAGPRIVVDKWRSNVLYARRSSRLFRSTDSGATWPELNLPRTTVGPNDLTTVFGFELDPQIPDRLYVAMDSGLRFSEDAGQSWVLAYPGETRSLAVGWGGPFRLFAATGARGSYTIISSEDRGRTWRSTASPQIRNAPPFLLVDPVDGNRLYVMNPEMSPATFVLRLRRLVDGRYQPSYGAYVGNGELRDLTATIDGQTVAVLSTGVFPFAGDVQIIRISR